MKPEQVSKLASMGILFKKGNNLEKGLQDENIPSNYSSNNPTSSQKITQKLWPKLTALAWLGLAHSLKPGHAHH